MKLDFFNLLYFDKEIFNISENFKSSTTAS